MGSTLTLGKDKFKTMNDSDFLDIGLKWLPWIGSNYFSVENKLLIVGESHYGEDNSNRLSELDDKNFTRECVIDMGVNNNRYNVKFYQNIHSLLFNKTKLNTEEFWSRVCFHNFIQTSMRTSNARPVEEDFNQSALVFFDLLYKLRPEFCLMCGVSSINAIRNNLADSHFTEQSFTVFNKVGRTYPRILKLLSDSGHVTTLVFIKHPSKYFSHTNWNLFLSEKTPKMLQA